MGYSYLYLPITLVLLPIVPKSNNSVRVCGGYKATVNPYTENDKHHLPRNEELIVKLSRTKLLPIFVSDAYFQQPGDDKTGKVIAVITHGG